MFVAVSIAMWRALLADVTHTVASQIDYEDAGLCKKFGFPAGTTMHEACKLDLLDLRHSHERLLAADSVP